MRIVLYCLLISILVFSCQQEIHFELPNSTGNVNQPSPVQASLQGKVTDENDLPVSGAIVKSGAYTTTTDSRGLFFFKSIQLDKYSSLVTIEKAGYFKGFRNFSVKQGSYEFVKIKLVPKVLAGTINSQTGGAITLPDNSIITISSRSIIVKATNQEYTGNIRVYAKIIDPSAADISETVPGGFNAIDSQNKKAVLKSYGMIAVELQGQNNESLQLGVGKTAKLKISIPSSLQASSPASMPLWSLNETTGIWKQEGKGIKTNNYYEGDISHFSFWNYDLFFFSVFLELTLKNAQGIPLPHTKVFIEGLTSGIGAYDYTDTSGYVSGFVLNYQPLRLEVMNTCDQVIFSKDLGQLSQNTNLGNITVTLPVQYTMQVTGNVVDCNNQPVTNGSTQIYFEGQLHESQVTNGIFSMTTTQCPGSSPLEVIAIDSVANQQSVTYSFNPVGPTLNTGTLNACGTSIISFFNYSVDGVNYSLSSANGDTLSGSANLDPNGTGFRVISGISRTRPNTVFIDVEYDGTLTPGTFPIVSLGVNQLNNFAPDIPFNVTITNFGTVGQFIEGSINARVLELGTNFHTITGNFKLKRID